MTPTDQAVLPSALTELREAVAATRLPLELPGVDGARRERVELLNQLDDYLIPRATHLDAPLLVVVGGSTGAGKSTLVNSLIGEIVTKPGVLRPTTRSSTIVHNPADEKWFTGQRVLPELARLTGTEGENDPRTLRLVATDAVPQGLAVLDAPDIDSVVSANRDLARQLLSAADMWVFVTTAARYADAVPWELLQQASERGTAVGVVLDRVPDQHRQEVGDDLHAMLREHGLARAPFFVITESELDDLGRLPFEQIRPMRRWLGGLAQDQQARSDVIRQTLGGALDSLAVRSRALEAAAGEQSSSVGLLKNSADGAYSRALDGVKEGMRDGSLLRGEVLARWQDFVGTGELLRQLEGGVGKLRDRVTSMIRGRGQTAPAAKGLEQALQHGVAALLMSHGETAASSASREWRSLPGGAPLVAAHPELATVSDGFGRRVESLVREWQDDVLQMVRDEAGDKRTTARFLAFGISGIAAMLMVISFSATGGLTGAEVGIAGGSAAVAQRVLEAVFGDQAVRSLSAKARTRLLERAEQLFGTECGRYDDVLAGLGDLSASSALAPAFDHVRAAR